MEHPKLKRKGTVWQCEYCGKTGALAAMINSPCEQENSGDFEKDLIEELEKGEDDPVERCAKCGTVIIGECPACGREHGRVM